MLDITILETIFWLLLLLPHMHNLCCHCISNHLNSSIPALLKRHWGRNFAVEWNTLNGDIDNNLSAKHWSEAILQISWNEGFLWQSYMRKFTQSYNSDWGGITRTAFPIFCIIILHNLNRSVLHIRINEESQRKTYLSLLRNTSKMAS